MKKQSFKSTMIMCQPNGSIAGDGIPGCMAPMGCISSLILRRLYKRRHLPLFFGMTNMGVFHGLTEGLMWPAASCSATSYLVICSRSSVMGHWSTHTGSLESQVNGGLGDCSPVPMTKKEW